MGRFTSYSLILRKHMILSEGKSYTGTRFLFEFQKKLVQLVKMCLSDPISRVRIDNNISDSFKIHNGLKQGDALSVIATTV